MTAVVFAGEIMNQTLLFAGKAKGTGFTLIELMAVIAVAAVLAAVAYPVYRDYVRRARLFDVKTAMLDNANALERHYMRRFSFKQTSTAWATLPHPRTQHFCIRMQGNPRGTNTDSEYRMKAVAWDKDFEPRVLVMNQDKQVFLCESSVSSCEDTREFFANPGRADKNCVSQ